jgi:hypothetical protein
MQQRYEDKTFLKGCIQIQCLEWLITQIVWTSERSMPKYMVRFITSGWHVSEFMSLLGLCHQSSWECRSASRLLQLHDQSSVNSESHHKCYLKPQLRTLDDILNLCLKCIPITRNLTAFPSHILYVRRGPSEVSFLRLEDFNRNSKARYRSRCCNWKWVWLHLRDVVQAWPNDYKTKNSLDEPAFVSFWVHASIDDNPPKGLVMSK